MQNIGFSNSGYVIKPPQPTSTVHGAPPFTGYQKKQLSLPSGFNVFTSLVYSTIPSLQITYFVPTSLPAFMWYILLTEIKSRT